MSFEDHLTSAMRASVDTLTPPVTGLASGGLQRGRQLRRRRRIAAGGAAVALVAVAGAGTAALLHDGSQRSVVTAAGSCAEPRSRVLPTWARDGFSDPEPKVPYVLSDDGRMAAILFGPLQAPSAPDRNNKVLWVTRPDSAGYPLDDRCRAGRLRRHRRAPAPRGSGPLDRRPAAARVLDARPPVGRVPRHHRPRVRPALASVSPCPRPAPVRAARTRTLLGADRRREAAATRRPVLAARDRREDGEPATEGRGLTADQAVRGPGRAGGTSPAAPSPQRPRRTAPGRRGRPGPRPRPPPRRPGPTHAARPRAPAEPRPR